MLDDENGLANIKVIINGTIAQDASFNGYDTTENNDTFNNVTNTSQHMLMVISLIL